MKRSARTVGISGRRDRIVSIQAGDSSMTGTAGSGMQGPSNLARMGKVAFLSGSHRRVWRTTASPAWTEALCRPIS